MVYCTCMYTAHTWCMSLIPGSYPTHPEQNPNHYKPGTCQVLQLINVIEDKKHGEHVALLNDKLPVDFLHWNSFNAERHVSYLDETLRYEWKWKICKMLEMIVTYCGFSNRFRMQLNCWKNNAVCTSLHKRHVHDVLHNVTSQYLVVSINAAHRPKWAEIKPIWAVTLIKKIDDHQMNQQNTTK